MTLTDKQRIDRCEKALAQAATAAARGHGWRPASQGQTEWAEIHEEQQQLAARELEQREEVTA